MQSRADDAPSVGHLLKQLAGDTGTLVRDELALARTEMVMKGKTAARSSAVVLAGGAVANAALLTLVAAAVMGLQTFVPAWMSALAIGSFLAIVSFVLVRVGLGRLERIDVVPEHAVASLHAETGSARSHRQEHSS